MEFAGHYLAHSSEVEGSSARHILLAPTQIERTIDWSDEFAVAHTAAVGHPTTRWSDQRVCVHVSPVLFLRERPAVFNS